MIISSLKNQAHFDLVNKQGRKMHSPYFLLVLAKQYTGVPKDTISDILFGMKVNRKLGNAVIRNKIKRRIRHLIREALKKQKTNNRMGLIIVPKKGFEKVEFSILQNEFKNFLHTRRIKLAQ